MKNRRKQKNPLKYVIIPVAVLILLGILKISILAGFTLIIGLVIGSIGEKLRWWGKYKL